MPAPRFDHNCGKRFDRDQIAVQLQVPFTFEYDIDFGGLSMVVTDRLFCEIQQVNGSWAILTVGKGPPDNSTGAILFGKA
tara:strand:+ start:119 stop:358 length:240 start_codon:yes stop_codon:yes gene_type:complete